MPDIDFGQLSEALNDKSDRDLRNVDTTAKADAVIDYQEPTSANNYTWYRKYKSGWVEQGGVILNYSTDGWQSAKVINLPVAMQNNKYCITWLNGWTSYTSEGTAVQSKSTTSFTISQFTSYSSSCTASWQVSGVAAN